MDGEPNTRIFSVHEYEFEPHVTDEDVFAALREAEARGCFDIPGLVDYRFGKGIRGTRNDQFVAIWVWADYERWADLWGPVDDPVSKDEYPEPWLVWEDEILDPLLATDPDRISYTAYEAVDPTG